MSPEDVAFACDLSRLSPAERERERVLLGAFKRGVVRVEESDAGWKFHLPASQEFLREVGELLALERLCCPFLEFQLEVGAAELAVIHVFGRAGAKPVIAAEFMP